jgi:hypothetical protein
MVPATKCDFLAAYGFPHEWLQWDLYPDPLFEVQRAACANDEEPKPDEHLRHGAFLWWLRTCRLLSEDTLKQLARLAALDPDPEMAGAAAHEILLHPCATEGVADELARLVTENQTRWQTWAAKPAPHEFFRQILNKGRQVWAERYTAHRIVKDVGPNQLSTEELRRLFALRSPLIWRALVEHPNLPDDLLSEMATMENLRYSRDIRIISKLRLARKPVPHSAFLGERAKDTWFWSR